MTSQSVAPPVARLDFAAKGPNGPGWYIHYVVDGRPTSKRLAVEVGADAFGAVEQAAELLGCSADQITCAGPAWPRPLDGLVDAAKTLEYVPDPMPAITHRRSEWRRFTRPADEPHFEARRHPRRVVRGLLLDGPVSGRVVNWSDAGMGIEIASPLRANTRGLFVVRGKRSRSELNGEVRWCTWLDGQSLADRPRFRAGVSVIG